MRSKKQHKSRHDDLFRSHRDQIINMKHELVVLADKIDWDWLDDELADCFSSEGRPAEPVRFMIGMFLLKETFNLADAQVWERWVNDPYFQYFTGEEFFQHALAHERSGTRALRHTLDEVIEETEALTRHEVERIYVDKGYRGHNYPNPHRVFKSGQKRGVHGQIKKELKRRSAIEPVIGHCKSDGHMGRNFLKGRLGDQINAVMSAVGYNMRLILKWLRNLLSKIVFAILKNDQSKFNAQIGFLTIDFVVIILP